ncbi:MAG: hypothetical protein ACPLZ9_00330 [Candidatus Ratteibacteria bacterium]
MNQMTQTIQTSSIESQNKLYFTGNWFIDAGILGFVNLMETVYGWDLEKLQKKISEEPDKVYFGYFPFAYLYKLLLDKHMKVKPELIENLEKELEEKTFQDNESLFNFVWNTFICDLFEESWVEKKSKLIYKSEAYDKKNKKKCKYKDEYNSQNYLNKIEEREKIINQIQILKHEKVKTFKYKDLEKLMDPENNKSISEDLKKLIESLKAKHLDLEDFLKKEWENNVVKEQKFAKKESKFYRLPIDDAFYKNFLFFHTGKGIIEQRDLFYEVINSDLNEESLKKIDKTINKLLPSQSDFSNINYTKMSTEKIKKQFKLFEIFPIFVSFLCFKHAFKQFRMIGNVFFYSNDLEFSYLVNKKLSIYKDIGSNDENAIFRFTWQQIIDLLVEYKSSWSLENMYIISYEILDNKKQKDVKYIGIPKLQASIIFDDSIREALNKNIQFREDKYCYCWLLEQFIKGEPLYPVIFDHVMLCINDNRKNINYYASTYALSVEANILNFKAENSKKNEINSLFSTNHFFNNYKSLVSEIKEDIRYSSYSASLINQISKDADAKKRLARDLLSALRARDKNRFLNILLKNMNEEKELSRNHNLNRWLSEKIIKNNISFEMYSLMLVINLLKDKGGKNE